MIWGGIRQPLKFPLASRAARLRIADCLPGDYNIPRNSFNSLADLHEIWHTWLWWAEAIAHQFWVEYDNSEFSVPSMGMFNDFKLLIYVKCFSRPLTLCLQINSTQSYCTVLVGHGHFICKVSAQSLWEQKTYARFKIISKPNMSYCSATWLE